MLEKEVKNIIQNLERGVIDLDYSGSRSSYVSRDGYVTSALIKVLDDAETFAFENVIPGLYDVYERPSLRKTAIFKDLRNQSHKVQEDEYGATLKDWGVFTYSKHTFTFIAQFEYKPFNSYKVYSIIYYFAPTIEGAKITLLPF